MIGVLLQHVYVTNTEMHKLCDIHFKWFLHRAEEIGYNGIH